MPDVTAGSIEAAEEAGLITVNHRLECYEQVAGRLVVVIIVTIHRDM